MLHNAKYISGFCKIFFQELHACRGIIEEISNNNRRTLRAAGLFVYLYLSGFQMQMNACDCFPPARKQIDPCDGRDRCKSFTSKTKRADRSKILFASELAGRVTAECDRCILRRHAAAIVCDTEIGNAAVFNFNCNAV